ncbi:hypothetical protein F5Y10DRAFT_239235 [Nemania abortiva]|nr:hypothetical protein F5Y10DRAFT_239235 [Nemania abortiva]
MNLDRTRAQPIGGVNSAIRSHQTTDMHPNPHIAYKSTPAHQLYFPEELVLALKQNRIKWDSKKHSEGLVFVVARIVNSDVADMRVFSTLQDATVDALHMMVNEHPEAFALPRTTDADGDEVKPPRMQRATSIIREITARPNFKQVSMSNAIVDQGDNSQNTGTQYADYQNTSPSYRGMSVQTMGREADLEADIDAEAEAEAEDSLFVIKGETPELPRPPRIADPRPYLNERGEVLLGDGPEPTYMFWGKCKISSFCLKMEARRVDGAPIKVSVHLKNLRKPLHDA